MISRMLDRQYRRPAGLLGLFIGRQMAVDHLPENRWTVALVDAQPTDHILEIGFGSGVAIEALASRVANGKIVGVDFSKAMVATARRRNAQAIKNWRVELHYSTADRLPFGDSTFDKIFSIHSVYFWPDPDAALHAIYRVLKPEGRVILTILPKEMWNTQNPNAPVGTPECHPYYGDELCEILQHAGYSETTIQADTDPKYPSNYSVVGIKSNSATNPSERL